MSENSILVEEYKALREAINNRIETRDRIMQINTTFLAAVLALSTAKEISPTLLLIYPPICTLFAVMWSRNELNIHLLRFYIRDKIESNLPGFGWESWRWKQRLPFPNSSNTPTVGSYIIYIFKSEFSLFLFSQIITIVIGLSALNGKGFTYLENILFLLDILSIIIIILGVIMMTVTYENIVKNTIGKI